MITAGFVENIIGKLQNLQFYSIIYVLESVINPHIIAYDFIVLGNKCPLVRLFYINCIELYKVKYTAQKWWCCIGMCKYIYIYILIYINLFICKRKMTEDSTWLID